MSRWRLTLHDDGGRAKLTLLDGESPLGVLSLPWLSYRRLVVSILETITRETRSALAKSLGEKLWIDAQRIWHDSPELAMQKLTEFGWTQSKVDEYADELMKHLLDRFTSFMPEHRT